MCFYLTASEHKVTIQSPSILDECLRQQLALPGRPKLEAVELCEELYGKGFGVVSRHSQTGENWTMSNIDKKHQVGSEQDKCMLSFSKGKWHLGIAQHCPLELGIAEVRTGNIFWLKRAENMICAMREVIARKSVGWNSQAAAPAFIKDPVDMNWTNLCATVQEDISSGVFSLEKR